MPSKNIPIYIPYIGKSEGRRVEKVLSSRWLTQGPQVEIFEKNFAAYVNAPFACAVSNCTTALHLALRAVGVKEKSEVITVSHSFIATANSIQYLGAIPVFADIDLQTQNIDPKKIESLISKKTAAILCVHQMGMPCDLKKIIAIGKKYKIPVIEDAACAIGSEIFWKNKWRKIGAPQGDIACFSFHPRKLLTTGDGGMLTTRNKHYDSLFRKWRQHSMSLTDRDRHNSKKIIFETYQDLGYNYRLTDIQAAVGIAQLEYLPKLLKKRRKQVAVYKKLLQKFCPSIQSQKEPVWAKSNWQSFSIFLPPSANQMKIMQALLENGIHSKRGIMCAHREKSYSQKNWFCKKSKKCSCKKNHCENLLRSEYAQDHSILLPLYHDLTTLEQQRIIFTLKKALSL